MRPYLIDVTRVAYRRFLGRHSTGIDRVGYAYVQHYERQARAVLSLGPFSAVLSCPDSDWVFAQLCASDPVPRTRALLLLLKCFLWRWWLPRVNGDVLFNVVHTYLETPHYARLLRWRGVKLVTFVHDLLPLTHPEWFRPGEYERHVRRMQYVSRMSSALIVNSNDTLATFCRFATENGLRIPDAAVARLGPGFPSAERGERPIPQPYFVVLGTIEPRKNHAMLLNVWRRLSQQMGDLAPRLVIIGRRGWECEHVIDHLERSLYLRDLVIELSDCNDAEAANWLHHARALLYPSFGEGYGLPLLEALVLGVPAIASDLPIFREVAGDVPDYLDPLDAPAWMQRIRAYMPEHSEPREAQLARLGSHPPMTWPEHFAEVDRLLARVALPAPASVAGEAANPVVLNASGPRVGHAALIESSAHPLP